MLLFNSNNNNTKIIIKQIHNWNENFSYFTKFGRKIWLILINNSQENNVILNGPKIGLVSTMQIKIQSYLDFGVKYDQDVSS